MERAPRPALAVRRVLADADDVGRMARRLAVEIVEKNRGAGGLALVGIRTGGLHLARRLVRLIAEVEGAEPPLGAVDIALYRDDVADLIKPAIGPTELPFAVEGMRIVLIDDVLYTGRTVRAALDALNDYGRPGAVQLAVLVDRGRRELPIQADFVGMTVATDAEDRVRVRLTEAGPEGTEDAVVLLGADAARAGRDPGVPHRHLLGIEELDADDIVHILDLAETFTSWASARSRRCRPCAAGPSSTCSSRPRPGPGPRSSSRPSG